MNTRSAKTCLQNRLKVQDNASNCQLQTLQQGTTTKNLSMTQIQLQQTHSHRPNKPDNPQSMRPVGHPRNVKNQTPAISHDPRPPLERHDMKLYMKPGQL
jgi:hypothetical protein